MDVHLIDGTYELFRTFYGAPSAQAPDGREVGATRGLLRSWLGLVTREDATHVAVAFDHVIESFRNELFAGYKTGEGIDPALFGQFELAEEATRAFGFVVWPMIEFEADDALASGAARYAREPGVDRVLVCTPDKDLAQCVEGSRVLCVDRRRAIERDHDAVIEKYGVPPASIPDWLALVGDDADGIPGLPGWGAKSSAAVLSAFGKLEAIPDDPGAWVDDAGAKLRVRGGAKLAATLSERREDALLYRTLATLRRDVELTESVDGLLWRGADRAALEAICARIDFA